MPIVPGIWFGSVGASENFFEWVPCPPPSMEVQQRGYFDEIVFEGGGVDAARSKATHKIFNFSIPIEEAAGAVGLDAFEDYADGSHGDGLCYFSDAMTWDTNMFPRHWAAPRLVEQGWPNISVTTPTFAATAVNSYSQPARKGSWAVTSAANATPLTDSSIPFVVLPIPPGYVLHVGVTGAATGTAVVRVESWVNGTVSAGASSSLTLLSETGATRMNATVSGDTYAFAKVFITRTSSAVSTLTLVSMMAQLWPVGVSPTLTGAHVRGGGHTGLMFADDGRSTTYELAGSGKHYKGLSTRLVEVGAWRTP